MNIHERCHESNSRTRILFHFVILHFPLQTFDMNLLKVQTHMHHVMKYNSQVNMIVSVSLYSSYISDVAIWNIHYLYILCIYIGILAFDL